MGLEDGKWHAVLGEHIGDGELTAVGIPAVGKVHLADLVRVCLHEDGNASVLEGGDGPILVGEDGHGEDHAVILALMLLQPLGVQQALVPGLHAAVAGELLVHHDVAVPGIGDGLDHVVPGAVDQFPGHEAAVAESQRKCHLPHVHQSSIIEN